MTFDRVSCLRFDKTPERHSGDQLTFRRYDLEAMPSIAGPQGDEPEAKLERWAYLGSAAQPAGWDSGRRTYARGQNQILAVVANLVRQFEEVVKPIALCLTFERKAPTTSRIAVSDLAQLKFVKMRQVGRTS